MKLSHVAFTQPIPIPGTHVRQADFAAVDGWSIDDDEGRITLHKGTTRFHTYVSASCVEDERTQSATAVALGLAEPRKKGKR